MARIHYEIPDDLHRKIKAIAAAQGITLKEFVITALNDATEKPKLKGNAQKFLDAVYRAQTKRGL